MTDTADAGPDLLYGMSKIAAYLDVTRNVAYHLAATNRIPTFKVGKTVCARRSKLLEALQALEDKSAA